ncbi:hypothetical protein ABTY61_32285 [Kitasatospora sp. NPDC096128]|uniref:hypothetical protein n=1 Tax=Kitasatospora sp. NPDC096128 TaxID=3155547 RepID=UPI003328CD5C
MSVGPRTSTLTQITSTARRRDVAATYAALTQACVITGDDARRAELVGEHPQHAWWLPASNALALVHSDLEDASVLLRAARLLERHRVAVVPPYYDEVRACSGFGVTFWYPPGRRRFGDEPVSAWVSAAVHRIHPDSASWLADHDPFDGLLDGLDDALLDEAGRWFLRERAAELREQWERIEWPSPPTVVLGVRRMVECRDAGAGPRLVLRRPLWRGHREWDLTAARWRSELLRGRPADLAAFTAAYASHGRPFDGLGAWPDYQVVRDVVVLAEVMDTVRRAHVDVHLRQQAAHQVACLRGAHQGPWNWGRR